MNALRRILDAMIPGSQAGAAQPNNRVAQIGSAGRMNPNNTKLGKAREMKPYKMPYKEIAPLNKPLLKDGFPAHYQDNTYRLPLGNRNEYVEYKRVPEEDARFVGNPRNLNQYSPSNADISNFPLRAEDDYMVGPQYSRINNDIRNWNQRRSFVQSPISAMQGGIQPVDMDTIPTNFTGGRTGYYQGSNPYLNNLDDDYRLRVR